MDHEACARREAMLRRRQLPRPSNHGHCRVFAGGPATICLSRCDGRRALACRRHKPCSLLGNLPLTYLQRRRTASWLGLVAMFLLLVGPLLGQSLAQTTSAPAWLSELSCAEGHEAPAQPTQAHMDWAKCGYCTLLLQSPALTSAQLFLAAPLPAVEAALCPRTLVVQGSPVFPGALTRAPPYA